MGRLIAFLRERNLYERSLVIFLSDHGEGLNDHGEDEHGALLYREEIHVPLFVKFPGGRRAGESVREPVALTDVFPTIAAVADLPAPAGLAGQSLAAAGEEGKPAEAAARRVYSETLYPRLHLGWSDLASLTDDRHQYIESPKPELYDIVADPAEKNDLAPGLPPAFRALSAALARMPRPLQPPGVSDPEAVKKLAALGYISATSADLNRKDLPPPRERIGAVAELKHGFGALQGARYAEAAAVFQQLLQANPGMVDVWQLYAEACLKLGRDDDALAALQTAAKLSPGNPQVLMALSDYYLATGNYAEARKHAELVGESGAANPHENLARIALAEGNLEAAERESRAALERYPTRRVPHMILGRVARDRRDYPGALAELALAARAQETGGSVPDPEPQFPARRLPGPPGSRGRGGGGLPPGAPRLPVESGAAHGAGPSLRQPGARGRRPKLADEARAGAAHAGGVLRGRPHLRGVGRSAQRAGAPHRGSPRLSACARAQGDELTGGATSANPFRTSRPGPPAPSVRASSAQRPRGSHPPAARRDRLAE